MSALPLHHLRFLDSGGLHRPPRRAKTGPGRTNRAASSLECALTRQRRAPAVESTLTSSLDLKSHGIRASWPFGGAEVLWRSATAVTSLEYALTENAALSSLEYALTELLDLKSFRFRTYKKRGGGGSLFLLCLICLPRQGARRRSRAERGRLGSAV